MEETISKNFQKISASQIETRYSIKTNLNQSVIDMKQLVQRRIDNLEKTPIFSIGKQLENSIHSSKFSNWNDALASFQKEIPELVRTFELNQNKILKGITDLKIENRNNFVTQTKNITQQFHRLAFDVGAFLGKLKVSMDILNNNLHASFFKLLLLSLHKK